MWDFWVLRSEEGVVWTWERNLENAPVRELPASQMSAPNPRCLWKGHTCPEGEEEVKLLITAWRYFGTKCKYAHPDGGFRESET